MFTIPMLMTLGIYATSSAMYLLSISGLFPRAHNFARFILILACVTHLLSIGLHHVGGSLPEITSPLSLINLSLFVISGVYVLINIFKRTPMVGAIIAPFITIIMGTLWSSTQTEPYDSIPFITPIHIISSALGFSAFGVSFLASTLYLWADRRMKENRGVGWVHLPSINTCETVARQSVKIGFPFYTIGVITGSIWAFYGGKDRFRLEYAMGLTSWVIFAFLVYVEKRFGLWGRKIAVTTIVGFLAIVALVITYIERRL